MTGVAVPAAVEGDVDEAVARCLIAHAGGVPSVVYGRTGKRYLRTRIAGYNQAARHQPWLVIVDLNHEAVCAPSLRAAWVPTPSLYMCFRVAVREVESWLLADAERISAFLKISPSRVPRDVDRLDDPKQALLQLVRRSGSRAIREDMTPRPESGRVIGPAYNSRLIEFVTNTRVGWRPSMAARNSDSLNRCLLSIRALVQGYRPSRQQ